MISSIHPKRFAGGIHPESEGKELSAGQPIRIPPLLEKYTLPVHQNIGAPPKLIVRKGDEVKKGQLIAEADGFISFLSMPRPAGKSVMPSRFPVRTEPLSPPLRFFPTAGTNGDRILSRIRTGGIRIGKN